jgi:glycosyltransferase involved in cell wall biosynthesis
MTAIQEVPRYERSRLRIAAPPLGRVLLAMALEGGRKFGSMEEQVFLLARAFRRQGGLCLPLFLGPADGPRPAEFVNDGLSVECLELNRFRLSTLRRLRGLIERYRIEMVHWNFFHPLWNPYLWALSILCPGVAHYFTDHISRVGSPRTGGAGRIMKRLLLKRYRRVFGVSRFVVDSMERQQSWRQPECRLYFINTERFRPDAAVRRSLRRQMGVEGRIVLLTASQLIPEKGLDVCLRAMAELPEPVVLWSVGEGPDSERLHRYAAELGVQNRTRFLGLQRNVEPFMQAADCFVCPSLWEEAAGLVNLEAQACGLPVVASRIGGIPEYVDDGVTGLLYPPGESGALAACIRRLIDEPGVREDMGRAARELAERRFSPESAMDHYLDLYRG